MSLSLGPYLVGQVPQVYYVPEYISAEEEQHFISQAGASKAKWVELSGRRLQNHGGSVHEKGLIPAPIPSWLQPLTKRLYEDTLPIQLYGDGPPNHVLVNSYNPGEGIMGHEDGPAYQPGVCIVSLGCPAVIRFRRKQDIGSDDAAGPSPPAASLLLMPRSLLIFSGEAYTACTHNIDEVTEERIDGSVCNLAHCPQEVAALQPDGVLPRGGTRLSLTVRRVPRVIKGFMQLAGRK